MTAIDLLKEAVNRITQNKDLAGAMDRGEFIDNVPTSKDLFNREDAEFLAEANKFLSENTQPENATRLEAMAKEISTPISEPRSRWA